MRNKFQQFVKLTIIFKQNRYRICEHLHPLMCALKSDYIRDVVEKSSKENKLKVTMPDEMCKKYVPLIEEKILNTA